MLSSVSVCFSVKSIHNLKNCAKTFHDHLNPHLGSIHPCLNLVYTPHVGVYPVMKVSPECLFDIFLLKISTFEVILSQDLYCRKLIQYLNKYTGNKQLSHDHFVWIWVGISSEHALFVTKRH